MDLEQMEFPEGHRFEKFYHSFITWDIYNFFNAPLGENDLIESPEFVTNLRERIKWGLAIVGRRKCGDKYATEILLRRSPYCSGPNHILVKVRVAMIDNCGKAWFESTNHTCFYLNTTQIFRSFYKFDDMIDYYKPTCSNFDKLMITCDIILDIPLYFRQSDVGIDTDLKALSLDLKTFNLIGGLRDLDLIVGNRQFSVHSVIVKMRSPYVARILNENPRVRQIDLTAKGSYIQVKALIAYWYSGDLETLPRTPSTDTYNFILNMEQFELVRYVYPETIELSTIFETRNLDFTWCIEQFSYYENLDQLECRTFYSFTCETVPWNLYLYPKATKDNTDYIALSMKDVENNNPYPVYLEIFLKDEIGAEYGCQSTVSWLHTHGVYSFPEFVKMDEFAGRREILLKDDILRLGCRIKYGTGGVNSEIESFFDSGISVLKKVNTYTTLANEMRSLLESEDMSDVFLKVGGRMFRVHKAVLAARSRYFDCVLRKPEHEISKYNVIMLEDIEPEHLDMILRYIYYAEKIQLNPDLALKLYPALHKYKITLLENLCSDYLHNHLKLSDYNAIELENIFRKISH